MFYICEMCMFCIVFNLCKIRDCENPEVTLCRWLGYKPSINNNSNNNNQQYPTMKASTTTNVVGKRVQGAWQHLWEVWFNSKKIRHTLWFCQTEWCRKRIGWGPIHSFGKYHTSACLSVCLLVIHDMLGLCQWRTKPLMNSARNTLYLQGFLQ